MRGIPLCSAGAGVSNSEIISGTMGDGCLEREMGMEGEREGGRGGRWRWREREREREGNREVDGWGEGDG